MANPIIALTQIVSTAFTALTSLGIAAEPVHEYERQTVFANNPTRIPSEAELVEANVRGTLDNERYLAAMKLHGQNDDEAALMRLNAVERVGPLEAISAFRRKIIDEAEFTDRMHSLGWNDEGIAVLLKVTQFYPSPSDLISFEAKSVYRPDIVETFKLDEEFDLIRKDPFLMGGVDLEQLKNFWIAHWTPPSYTAVRDFVLYGLLDPETTEGRHNLDQWFREAAIPPFWRDKYVATMYSPLTRVDIRRMWDLGVIDDDVVIENYMKNGYSRKNATLLLNFTKVYEMSIDLRARYSHGYINQQDIKDELATIDIPEDTRTKIFQRIVKNEQAARANAHKLPTMAQIIKAVRSDLIKPEKARDYLKRMGYDDGEIDLEFAISGVALGEELGTLTAVASLAEQFIAAQGKAATPPPDRLIELENAMFAARDAFRAAYDNDAPALELAQLESRLRGAESAFGQVLSQWELGQLG